MTRDWRDDRIEQLERENAAFRARVGELEKIAAEQAKLIEELRELLSRSSSNSSKPPSTDPKKAGARRKKVKSGRKQGAQHGHPKHERPLVGVDEVDKVVSCHPECCENCHGPLQDRGTAPIRHQVWELPVCKPLVTEFQQHAGWCQQCVHWTVAPLPKGVPTGSFGPSVVAMVGTLIGRFRLSKRLTCDALLTLFRLSISVGAVINCQNQLSEALAGSVAEASDHVQQQNVKNADETGWRQHNERAWLWVALSGAIVVFMIHARRSAEAANKLLGEIHGVLGTDRYAAYLHWPAQLHQVCWAHLKRDFQAIGERRGEAGRIGKALLEQERLLFGLWGRLQAGTLSRSTFQQQVRPIRETMLDLLVDGLRCRHGKTRRTCDKMLEVFDSFWTFVRLEGVEPTNNAAERAVRHGVLYRTICLGTQSEAGSRFVERILTVEATLRRQRRDMLQFLTQTCRAALNATTPPSLIHADPIPVALPIAA